MKRDAPLESPGCPLSPPLAVSGGRPERRGATFLARFRGEKVALGPQAHRVSEGRAGEVTHSVEPPDRAQPGGRDPLRLHGSLRGRNANGLYGFGVLALLLLPYLVALNVSSVWDANEAFYVETPREMVASGDWLLPTFNGAPRVNKPPLAYWLVGALYRLFGVDLAWERWLMALLATGSILLVYRLAHRLFTDWETALLAAGLFATCFRFLILSRRLLIDTLLLFLILLAISCFLAWLREGKRYALPAAALCFGLGVLTKGPVALLPGVFLGIYLVATGRLRRLFAWESLAAALLLALVSGSWFLALGWQRGWEPVIDFFLSENLGRYLASDFGPRRNGLYYVGVFLGDFFPWSLLFPAAALWGLGRRRSGEGSPSLETTRLLLLWFVTYFVLFSLSRNKQEYYILPLYPAAALLIAAWIRQRPLALWLRTGVGLALVLAGVLVALLAGHFFPEVRFGAGPALLFALAGLLLFLNRPLPGVLVLSLGLSSGLALYSGPMEAYKPVRPLAETIRRQAAARGAEQTAGTYRFTAPSLRFYLDRDILETNDASSAIAFLRRSEPAFLITDPEGLAELQAALGSRLRIEEVRAKLYTTARTVVAGFAGQEPLGARSWTRPVYLVSNAGAGSGEPGEPPAHDPRPESMATSVRAGE